MVKVAQSILDVLAQVAPTSRHTPASGDRCVCGEGGGGGGGGACNFHIVSTGEAQE